MRSPYGRGVLISVNNGSLADYYENGGTEASVIEEVRKHNQVDCLETQLRKVGDAGRFKFECPDEEEENCLIEINCWIMRVMEGVSNDAYRVFFSSEGVQEQRVLRGLNP